MEDFGRLWKIFIALTKITAKIYYTITQ